jgi:hypothetical protein
MKKTFLLFGSIVFALNSTAFCENISDTTQVEDIQMQLSDQDILTRGMLLRREELQYGVSLYEPLAKVSYVGEVFAVVGEVFAVLSTVAAAYSAFVVGKEIYNNVTSPYRGPIYNEVIRAVGEKRQHASCVLGSLPIVGQGLSLRAAVALRREEAQRKIDKYENELEIIGWNLPKQKLTELV